MMRFNIVWNIIVDYSFKTKDSCISH